MKTTMLALITTLGLCASAHAIDSLTTTDHTVYSGITYSRVDPDGVYIEYQIPDGKGVGMSKIKFNRLTEEQQKEFGFDAAKAKDWETKVAKANDEWRANAQKAEQQAAALRAAQEVQAVQDESAKTQRILATAQLKQAEADLARANGGNGGGYGYDSGGWGGFALPAVTKHPVSDRTFAPVVTPIPFPQQHTTPSTFRGTSPSPFHFSR